MAQIKFNSRGSSAAFGNFAPGDVLVCSDAQAKHFVEDAQCATYLQAASADASASAPPADPAANSTKAAGKTGKKAATTPATTQETPT